MQCPRCQAENCAGRRFCAECGAPLALPCSSCGFSNEPEEKFCGGCGTPLSAAPRPPEPPARAPQSYTPGYLAEKILTAKNSLEGECKQVTVLFADLKGSMELLADRDPEEARQLLDPVLERLMAAVHRYEGTVNQVMGDGIMALFGAPLPHEDHAVRACYAALAMQDAMHRYSAEVRRTHGVEVQIRVGLNSSEVVVRAIGNDLHMDYSAIGQTTHLAARMEQLATPGSIRLTAETLRLAEGLTQVNPLGPVPVRGLTEPVDVYELVGPLPPWPWHPVCQDGTAGEGEERDLYCHRDVPLYGHDVLAPPGGGAAGAGEMRPGVPSREGHGIPLWLAVNVERTL